MQPAVLPVALRPSVTFPAGRSHVPVQAEALAVPSVAVGAAGDALAGQAAARAVLGRPAVWGGAERLLGSETLRHFPRRDRQGLQGRLRAR